MSTLAVSNDIADWGSSAITTETSRFDTNRVPYAITITNNVGANFGLHAAPIGEIVWYHYRLRTATAWSFIDDGEHVRIRDINNQVVAIIDASNGQLRAQAVGNSTAFGAFSTALTGNTFFTIDLKVQVNAVNVVVTLYINGALISIATDSNTSESRSVARNFNFTQVDIRTSFFSEFRVADDDTRGIRVVRLSPTSDGFYTQWEGGFALINDNNELTGIQVSAAGKRQSVGLANYSFGALITSVVLTARGSATGTGPTKLKQFLRISAVDHDGVNTPTLEIAQTNNIEEYLLDPSDDTPWTSAKVNAVESGVLSVA